MYTDITGLRIDIFNEDASQFIGEATFDLTEESKRALLQLVNYNVKPRSLTVLNVDFYQPSENFVAPSIYETIGRSGIITGFFLDAQYGFQVPIQIRMRYDVRARSNGENPYFFSSLEFTDITVDSVEQLKY